MKSPLKISEESYNESNAEMRRKNPGMGKKLTSGTNPRRVSFACRFAVENDVVLAIIIDSAEPIGIDKEKRSFVTGAVVKLESKLAILVVPL